MPLEDSPGIELTRDRDGHVRSIDQSSQPFVSAALIDASPRQLADEYLRANAADLSLGDMVAAGFDPGDGVEVEGEPERLRAVAEKDVAGMSVVVYEQTVGGLPVIDATVAVQVNRGAQAVIGATNQVHYDVEIPNAGASLADYGAELTPSTLASALHVDGEPTITISRGVVYRYDPAARLDTDIEDSDADQSFSGEKPSLPVPPPDVGIEPGNHYVATEVLFTYSVPGWDDMNWQAIIEPVTGAVLRLRAFVDSVNGSVFAIDPVTQGCGSCTGGSSAADLDKLVSQLPLSSLTPPGAGNPQALTGARIEMKDINPPHIAPPTEPVNSDFTFSAVTDGFAAVNAYQHCELFFELVASLGLTNYFPGTTFPVPVDARGEAGAVNAHAYINATGNGLKQFTFGLVEAGKPVGIASALRVVFHEFGHAVLYNHIGSGNFGFAHSCGDSLAVIYSDPNSLAADKGLTFPFVRLARRHDRTVAQGWAWFGPNYNTGYNGEQVLSSTMYRAYQSIGGSSTVLAHRQFASSYTLYLILAAVGLMSQPTTDPSVYASDLMKSDKSAADFQGSAGGAAYKVIRWSFEQQGLYQAPNTQPPITTKGLPPDVDVYIDDGRTGEYQWIQDWDRAPYTSVWNRNSADGSSGNQTPVPGQPNYVYGMVSNRGTATATGVNVKGFQAPSGAAGNWPTDWSAMTTPSVNVADIATGQSMVAGPFQWTPSAADDKVLLVANASGDAPIVDNPQIPNMSLPNWRLVPTDNNIVQSTFA